MSFQNKEKRINIKPATIEIEGITNNEKYQSIKYIDNILGCIYGNCLGDAYGLSTEFLNKKSIEEKYPNKDQFIDFPDYIANRHNKRWDKGDWTDDSDQMILILQTLIETSNENNGDNKDRIILFSKKLRNWVENGFEELGDQAGMGLGQTVGNVVFDENFLDNPTMVSKFIWINGGKKMAANGSLMRTSILGCLDFLDDRLVFQNTIDFCKITHYDSRCIVSCIIFTKLICDILKFNFKNSQQQQQQQQSDQIKEILNEILFNKLIDNGEYQLISKLLFNSNQMISENEKQDYLNEFNKYIINSNEWEDLELDEASSIGYVYKCFGSAIVSLKKFNKYYNNNNNNNISNLFRKVLDELIREGGDSDTNGSVAGAALGTIIGYSNLPTDMLLSLPNKSWLDDQVVKFLDLLIFDKINSKHLNLYQFNINNDKLPNEYLNETDEKPFINYNNKKQKKQQQQQEEEKKNEKTGNCLIQ